MRYAILRVGGRYRSRHRQIHLAYLRAPAGDLTVDVIAKGEPLDRATLLPYMLQAGQVTVGVKAVISGYAVRPLQ
ncbi:MAG TPA: hypothetical protein VI756_13170 [Blastocatellia bacterium]